MSESLVSVIVPVYNVEKYLKRCLDSILCQTYRNIEIILVDDGSTDGSGRICSEYGRKDKRVKIISQKNSGVAMARNAGLRKAKGKYVAFVDSDDFVMEEYIDILVSVAKIEDADIVQCEAIPIRDDNTQDRTKKHVKVSQERQRLTGADALKLMLYQNTVNSSLWCKLIDKALFDGVDFPNGMVHEDLCALYFLLKKSKKVVIIDNRLYMYIVRSNSLIHSSFSKSTLDVLDVMEIIEQDAKRYPELNKAVESRKVNAYLFVLRQLPNKYKDLKAKLLAEVKRMRHSVLKDSMVRGKTKIGLLLSYFGLPVVKVAYSLLGSSYSERRIQ